ncbi:hypothetical protein BLOT_005991, partial [Blomia tropicalis]
YEITMEIISSKQFMVEQQVDRKWLAVSTMSLNTCLHPTIEGQQWEMFNIRQNSCSNNSMQEIRRNKNRKEFRIIHFLSI